MSSSYPPPPLSPSTADAVAAAQPPQQDAEQPPQPQSQLHQQHPQQQQLQQSPQSQSQPQSQPQQQSQPHDDDTQLQQQLQQHHGQLHPSYIHSLSSADDHSVAAATAAAAAAIAAHHGLQALQAAVSAPAPPPMQSPVTPQYATPTEPSYMSGSGTIVAPAPGSAKATRLRRACDMCSQRKVKCDEKQPCKPCCDLNVDCTFMREMKRRGPPNKHAEAAKAAKRPRLEPNLSPGPHNAAETLISIAGAQDPRPVVDAESIAPWPVLTLLIDDFFTYIHPLAPFPHEPTFRRSFANREDRTSREFLALLASMIGILVASFPRTARLHLKAQHGMNLFPKAIAMIERCRTVTLEARGPMFYNKGDLTVYDAATSYFLGLAAGYMVQYKLCRRFLTESMAFIREMGYHKPRDLGSSMFGVTYRGPPFDHVQDQLGKRLFWVMFLGVRSMSQLGGPHGEIILPPPTPTEPYPEFPAEVDDQYILPQQILGQPEGVVSLLTGFNQGIKIYMTMNGLVSIELSYGISTLPFHDQKVMLDECLQAVKQVMDDLPRELTIDLNNALPCLGLEDLPPAIPPDGIFDEHGFQYCPPAYPAHQPPTDIRHAIENNPEHRRLLQYEIQKANIYVSQLATRSYYVERYLNLRDVHRENTRVQTQQAIASDNGLDGSSNGVSSKSLAAAALQAAADSIDTNMSAERELIVQNLLTVLTSISQRNMEPNGGSLINKIRQVASTLINDAPERKGPVAVKAEEPLSRFVDILMRLEKTGPGNLVAGGGTMTPQDEEQELRNWADLREHQIRFYQGGGYLRTF
ncbi:hypothetical protein B0T26DRAFT_833070 [Lasiosphaeria miniovina]|uniref:Zn(2)-C6 fungal-type domain-containing protein n=1 Tax=Lasiosphaeria miniovina TaxID=1954250 RepID=A0AA40DUA7_9PEZI|nr:uncharacterized protein B0T26DRAFT_833070 [Lasiosphaeria miniovina]KAK0713496.1 hypothetical protein B0T26DRAFT_833070 [Lasiosphaeria miniovina]